MSGCKKGKAIEGMEEKSVQEPGGDRKAAKGFQEGCVNNGFGETSSLLQPIIEAVGTGLVFPDWWRQVHQGKWGPAPVYLQPPACLLAYSSLGSSALSL